MYDPKREMLRHLVATIEFRGNVAIRDAPSSFADFLAAKEVRTPAEILAHIGDLLQGSLLILKGEMRDLNAVPLSWEAEICRFFAAVADLDAFLASESALEVSIERITQGPVCDALTHIGQLVFLRRLAGIPVRSEPYFEARIRFVGAY